MEALCFNQWLLRMTNQMTKKPKHNLKHQKKETCLFIWQLDGTDLQKQSWAAASTLKSWTCGASVASWQKWRLSGEIKIEKKVKIVTFLKDRLVTHCLQEILKPTMNPARLISARMTNCSRFCKYQVSKISKALRAASIITR